MSKKKQEDESIDEGCVDWTDDEKEELEINDEYEPINDDDEDDNFEEVYTDELFIKTNSKCEWLNYCSKCEGEFSEPIENCTCNCHDGFC